jgi:hypothetical protein
MAGVLEALIEGLAIHKYEDWLIFDQRLRAVLNSGEARKIPVFRKIWGAGEEFYLDTVTGDVYVYVAPDSPGLPKWERVDAFEKPRRLPIHASGLSEIAIGTWRSVDAMRLQSFLSRLLRLGEVEVIGATSKAPADNATERRFRDLLTGQVYKLTRRSNGEFEWIRLSDEAGSTPLQ